MFNNLPRHILYISHASIIYISHASMIIGALPTKAQTKFRLLAHSLNIGHVDYIRIDFSCGTIMGTQSLLIGIMMFRLFINE